MSEDGDKDREEDAKRPSRPDNAAARRGRRASARAGGDSDESASTAGSSTPRRKSSGGASSGRGYVPSDKSGTAEDRQPLPKRIARYIREVLAELRKVVWPTRKQMSTYTVVVLAFMAFMIGLVWVLDLLFARIAFSVFG